MSSEHPQSKRVGGGFKTIYSNKKPLPAIKKSQDYTNDVKERDIVNVKENKKMKNKKVVRQSTNSNETVITEQWIKPSVELDTDIQRKEKQLTELSAVGREEDFSKFGSLTDDQKIQYNIKQQELSIPLHDDVFEREELDGNLENSFDNDQFPIKSEKVPGEEIQSERSSYSSEKCEKEKDDSPKGSELSQIREVECNQLAKPTKQVSHSTYKQYPILKFIQDNVIGNDVAIDGPYGRKTVHPKRYELSKEFSFIKRLHKITTGVKFGRGNAYLFDRNMRRSLRYIEDYIRENVCPMYANTHSETGHNAKQTSRFREEARQIIKKCVNAGKDDVVVFTGSGVTSCVHKLIWGLRLREKVVQEETVIFIGPYEHHSNILPWREMKTKLVRIKENKDGGVDIENLQDMLKFWRDKRRNLLVVMSAASNVTGIITDTKVVACMAHKYGAWVVFDYAAAGPYLEVDMNSSKHSYIDAALFSPHKFVGGPGTPGVIIAKKWMFRNSVPDRVGGGTVRYVTRSSHEYTVNIEEREEGGTPAIIESIRAGMVFQLKHGIGEEAIEEREEFLCRKAFEEWDKNEDLIILGNHTARRVAIFSFLVRHKETGKLIHQNFICTLLSELYGIQARGGCACAGPYAADLMGISENIAKSMFPFLQDKPRKDPQHATPKLDIMKPGFSRINLPFFYSDEMCDFIIQAISDVASHGWKLMLKYTFDAVSGCWRHKEHSKNNDSDMLSLHDLNITKDTVVNTKRSCLKTAPLSTQDTLTKAMDVFQKAGTDKYRASTASMDLQNTIPRKLRHLIWFMTPQDVVDLQDSNFQHSKRRHKELFTPRVPSPRVLLNNVQTPEED